MPTHLAQPPSPASGSDARPPALPIPGRSDSGANSVSGAHAPPQPRGSSAGPHLRPDLRHSLQHSEGVPFYLIEDPVAGKFFRLGEREWRFAASLGHDQEAEPAVKQENAMDAESAQQLLGWLAQNQLLQKFATGQNAAVPAQPPWNPFFINVPLVAPDRCLAAIYPWLAWLFTWPSFLGWCVLVMFGVTAVAQQWDTFMSGVSSYISPSSWVALWGTWILLKLVHETAHGLVCRKYGGRVGMSGVVLILFSPIAFVDVTSSWRFRSKWQRIFTAAAGMYVEFAIAAAAAIVWRSSDPGWLKTTCHQVVTAASLSTVIFNANPLMRFDGYYMLTDFLGLPNLSMIGRERFRHVVARVFLGVRRPPPRESRRRRFFIAAYGAASAVWKTLISVSLLIGAGTMFHGAGLVLAIFGGFIWFAKPLGGMLSKLTQQDQPMFQNRRRLVAVSLAIGIACGLVAWAPSPWGVSSPAIVRYADLDRVRAAADGFVKAIDVTSGQQVAEGQVLLRLRNDALVVEWKKAQNALALAEAEARRVRSEQRHAEVQVENENVRALAKKEAGLRKRVAGLTLRAARNGIVLTPRLDRLIDRYVEKRRRPGRGGRSSRQRTGMRRS